MIAWMNNWEYANHIPTSPWRSPMTLAREVSLHTIDGKPRLIQRAAGDFASLSGPARTFSLADTEISDGTRILDGAAGSVQRIDITLAPGSATEFGLIVRGNGDQGTRIGIRPTQGALIVDRRDSGQTDFHETFASIDTAPIRTRDGSYELSIYVDHCSVEVFAQDGQVTMTELIFPAPTSTGLAVYASGGTATITSLHVTQYA
jgi:levanase/fructan beta-fructosidase